MVAHEDISVDVLDLTGKIHTIEESHIGTNTRNNYYHILINFMTFQFTNSPSFLVFRKKISISPSIYTTSEDNYGNKSKNMQKLSG